MALEKIKFQTNVPVELALKFAEGKLCDSQFGNPQYMFSTTDDRAFFVDEKVAKKIHGLRLKPGEPIDIVKAEVDYTNGRKGIEWQITRINPPVGEQPDGTLVVPRAGAGARTPAPVPVVPCANCGRPAIGIKSGTGSPICTTCADDLAGAGARTPAPVTAASQQASHNGNGSKTNGNGNGNGNGNAPAIRPEGDPLMPWALFLLSQTRQLIDVYALSCQYAQAKHGGLMRGEDVRSLMLSAFINVSKNGGANVA